jgi:hypothetical protein
MLMDFKKRGPKSNKSTKPDLPKPCTLSLFSSKNNHLLIS